MPEPGERTAAQRFSETADGYARTMAPSLRRMAQAVVDRADLRPDEAVLDIGTGTGTAAAMARGEGRRVMGIDAAPGMLEIARREVDGAEFREMDFSALDLPDATFDVVMAVHALLFAQDPEATLGEWLRVTRPGGRVALSVPGPVEASPQPLYAEIYERYGVGSGRRFQTEESLAGMAAAAGWTDVRVEADPTTAIELPDVEHFRLWRRIGSQGAMAPTLTEEQHERLTDEMQAVTPRTPDGGFRIPFGTLYLVARAPGG